MKSRTINGRPWRDWDNQGCWEPVPQTSPRMRIAKSYAGGFDLWVYRYTLGNRQNCVGNFRTFKQAALAA